MPTCNHKERKAKWFRDHPEYFRKRNGFPEPTRLRPEICECCGGPPNGGKSALSLDHDHVTGEFRGWICYKCNTGIALLGDNFDGLQKAIRYLKNR